MRGLILDGAHGLRRSFGFVHGRRTHVRLRVLNRRFRGNTRRLLRWLTRRLLHGLTYWYIRWFLGALHDIGRFFYWFGGGYFELAFRLTLRDAPRLSCLYCPVKDLREKSCQEAACEHAVGLLGRPVFHCFEAVADNDVGVCLVKVYLPNLHFSQSEISIFEGGMDQTLQRSPLFLSRRGDAVPEDAALMNSYTASQIREERSSLVRDKTLQSVSHDPDDVS